MNRIPKSITYDDVQELLRLKDDSELESLIESYEWPLLGYLFGPNEMAIDDLNSFRCALNVLSLVLEMKSYIDSDAEIETKTLEHWGISEAGDLEEQESPLRFTIYSPYAGYSRFLFRASTLTPYEDDCDFYVLNAIGEPDWSISSFAHIENIKGPSIFCIDSLPKEAIKEYIARIIAQVITLHIVDLQTLITPEIIEDRQSTTVLSSIWWLAFEQMRLGRVGICKACETPFIAKRERGTKRKFCSDACRQWQADHPGITRQQWKAEKFGQRRNKATNL